MRPLLVTVSTLLVAITAAGCKKHKSTSTPMTSGAVTRSPGAAQSGEPGTATLTPVGKDAPSAPRTGPIYFELDSSDLSADARASLTELGEWLARNRVHLVVEGHADERGTTEYNIALGQRRAQVITDFLVRLGVDASRLDAISYGEERPVAQGASEDAHAQNRRGEVRTRP
jgi:peptidoglycan-associated lipoprotein